MSREELNEKMAFESNFEGNKGTVCALWLKNRRHKDSRAGVRCLRNSSKEEKGKDEYREESNLA